MAGIAAALIGGVASIGGSLIAGSAAKSAAKAQAGAAQKGIDAQREMFERQVELQEPFRQGGLASQNQLLTLLGIVPAPMPEAPVQYDKRGEVIPAKAPTTPQYTVDPNNPEFGSAAKAFGMDQFNADPGYAFRLSEGMKALERSAAARGGLLSGSTLKGISRYGQDMGSQEYQNAFNRYQVERQARLNPLQSLMGAGQTSAGTLTGAAGQLGQGLGQAAVAQGAAKASSYMNQSTALNNAIGGASQNFMMYNLMNGGGGGGQRFGMGGPYGYLE